MRLEISWLERYEYPNSGRCSVFAGCRSGHFSVVVRVFPDRFVGMITKSRRLFPGFPILAWLLSWLLLGQGLGSAAVLCFGLDGHVAVEGAAGEGRCGPVGTVPADDILLLPVVPADHCGSCIDVYAGSEKLFPTNSFFSTRTLQDGVAVYIPLSIHVSPAAPSSVVFSCITSSPQRFTLQSLQSVVLRI